MLPSYVRTPRAVFALIVVLFWSLTIDAQSSIFTYQGRLTDTSMPASGTYQMQFALYDAVTGGTQIGSTIENTAVSVSNGVFTVQLNYGAEAFPGAERYLEISVRRNSTDSYVPLTPRQRVTSAPYAIRAGNADNASNLGGTAASQYVQTNDTRLSDARDPLPNSGNYIQNTITPQSASFNISSNGSIGQDLTVGNRVAIGSTISSRSRLLVAEGIPGNYAILGSNDYSGGSTGIGVVGQALNNPGFGFGGYFIGGGTGVFAGANASTHVGVAYGIYGSASGSAGTRTGVYGNASVGSGTAQGYGLYGSASGPALSNIGVYGQASGATVTNWAGYFNGTVRVTGDTGIGIDPDGELSGTFGPRLTVSGTIRAGAGNATACDLQLGDDICFYDEQNASLAVRAFNGVGYAPVRAGGFINASSITLKKNITPLKRSDFNSMLRQIVELPLFTYRYKNETEKAPLHTGLIAERSPASVLSADGKAVDLYDFISLNAGATKALTAQVATLTSENDRQRKQLNLQMQMILSLRKIVCQQNPQAEVCKEDK